MPTLKNIPLTLALCSAIFAIAGCPASDPPDSGSQSSEQAVKSTQKQTAQVQPSGERKAEENVKSVSQGGSGSGAAMQGGPPAPGAPDPGKVEWTKEKYLPDKWPRFLPLPDDAEYETREFDSDTGTGRLKFSTLMGRGKLSVTYKENLEENGYKRTNLVPRKNSFLRKFNKGDQAIYVLVYDPKTKPNHRMVELRITQDTGDGGGSESGDGGQSDNDGQTGQSE